MAPKGKAAEKPAKDEAKAPEAPKGTRVDTPFNALLVNPIIRNSTIVLAVIMVSITLLILLLYRMSRLVSAQKIGAVDSIRGMMIYLNENYHILDDVQMLAKSEDLLTYFRTVKKREKYAADEVQKAAGLLRSGWQQSQGSFFYFSNITAVHSNATQRCLRENSYLAYNISEAEHMYLLSVARSRNLKYWIGLSQPDTTWRWANGDPLSDEMTVFWHGGGPDIESDGECVELRPCQDAEGNCWHNVMCLESNHWICKFTANPWMMADTL